MMLTLNNTSLPKNVLRLFQKLNNLISQPLKFLESSTYSVVVLQS